MPRANLRALRTGAPGCVGGRRYLLHPLHPLIFAGVLRQIAAAGSESARDEPVRPAPRALRQFTVLLGMLAVCLATMALGAALTAGSVRDWYPSLRKPAWTPPAWLFGPVWTMLYLLMALAAWLVWRRAGWAASRTALGLLAFQLALNAAWSGLFSRCAAPAAPSPKLLCCGA